MHIGPLASTRADGNNGHFRLSLRTGVEANVIASDGDGWEHVSVVIPLAFRCPTWEEMCEVRQLFWSRHVTVMQYHPPEREYVNVHPFCLHLWRQIGAEVPVPPRSMVG